MRDCLKRVYKCHICSVEGHFARDCPQLVSKEVPGALMCSDDCFPRHFILYCPSFYLASDPLEGRQDLIARCITQAFFQSHGLRNNVIFSIVSDASWKTAMRLEGRFLNAWKPDEASVRRRLKEVESTPLILPSVCFLLDEGGDAMEDVLEEKTERGNRETTFILGDAKGIEREASDALARLTQVRRVSLGPTPLLGSSCIAITHYLMDKMHHCPLRLWRMGS